MVKPTRWLAHLASNHSRVRRAFPAQALADIGALIRDSETRHLGEIRFVVEGALEPSALRRNQTAQHRALEVFSLLRIWDTEYNNGVLIFLLLADREVEIIADRGIDRCVGAAEWERICREMEACFRRGEYAAGVQSGIRAVSEHLIHHFPATGNNPNELPDQPTLL
jgi:uncharacterized membrane protein